MDFGSSAAFRGKSLIYICSTARSTRFLCVPVRKSASRGSAWFFVANVCGSVEAGQDSTAMKKSHNFFTSEPVPFIACIKNKNQKSTLRTKFSLNKVKFAVEESFRERHGYHLINLDWTGKSETHWGRCEPKRTWFKFWIRRITYTHTTGVDIKHQLHHGQNGSSSLRIQFHAIWTILHESAISLQQNSHQTAPVALSHRSMPADVLQHILNHQMSPSPRGLVQRTSGYMTQKFPLPLIRRPSFIRKDEFKNRRSKLGVENDAILRGRGALVNRAPKGAPVQQRQTKQPLFLIDFRQNPGLPSRAAHWMFFGQAGRWALQQSGGKLACSDFLRDQIVLIQAHLQKRRIKHPCWILVVRFHFFRNLVLLVTADVLRRASRMNANRFQHVKN